MREDGYYWVKWDIQNVWSIGFWNCSHWLFINCDHEFKDDEFNEIDERKITRGLSCTCKSEEKHGETSIMCCNHCGKSTEEFWK